MMWSDYIYEKATEISFIPTLGNIFGRCSKGGDDVFPHEYIRNALEKYSDAELTKAVAFGWLNAHGVRTVTDGYYEAKKAEEYRVHARSLELDYPQTAKVLQIIAADYDRDAKMDRRHAEVFPG